MKCLVFFGALLLLAPMGLAAERPTGADLVRHAFAQAKAPQPADLLLGTKWLCRNHSGPDSSLRHLEVFRFLQDGTGFVNQGADVKATYGTMMGTQFHYENNELFASSTANVYRTYVRVYKPGVLLAEHVFSGRIPFPKPNGPAGIADPNSVVIFYIACHPEH